METRKRKNALLTLLLMVMVASALVPVGESFLLVRRPDGSKRQITGVKQTQEILSALQSSSSSTGSFKEATVEWLSRLGRELKEVSDCASIVASAVMLKPDKVKAEDIVTLCDAIDDLENEKEKTQQTDDVLFVSQEPLDLRIRAMKSKRYEYLVKLMQSNYDAYVATASFLSPSRIARRELPNIQDVPVDKNSIPSTTTITAEDGKTPLVADCELEDMKYRDSLLDKILLSIFRNLVTKNTGGVTSDKPGIEGLLEQGRTYMLQPNQTPEAQHEMVYKTLGGLMTPALPPFYRIFMSGIIPKSIDGEGKQLGPWFYAPFLTSFVTPTFFGFLVGPSYPNRRKDGQLGGLVVEKCKFLQESGCKGLCLHQCKLPAQQFFQEELGLPLTVSPNFVTQECQWSFGETPLPPNEDPAFPKGCLVGCESRKAIAASGSKADICN
ncbi:protein of unknown function DUF4033 containing protein [Nitzschia inconspicua]|uniref:Beta-carotene isomerase D27-like C-terminal domain-containing protein n=1 Tax=Nitzschia inconspicua TaxID=303405 RepID=A0A9K3Q7R6_9STRA|nr:protein of unknown function DUF4033 containing protein [Nitzschia inconspicua]